VKESRRSRFCYRRTKTYIHFKYSKASNTIRTIRQTAHALINKVNTLIFSQNSLFSELLPYVSFVSGYEPGVIPDPGLPVTRQQSDVEEVILPDDSLADADLHDHDLIDSVMYIYFGSSAHTNGGPSRQVL